MLFLRTKIISCCIFSTVMFVFLFPGRILGAGDTLGSVSIWNDIAAPTPFDVLGLTVDVASFFRRIRILQEIQSIEARYPGGVPIVIEAHVIRHGDETKTISRFEIRRTWAGFRTEPMPKLGVKNFDGLVQISSKGTGPALSDWPGLKVLLTPKYQSVDACGVAHFGVIADFRADGKTHRITMPPELVKWDPLLFEAFRLETEQTAKYGAFVSRKPYETYSIYPVKTGRFMIGVHVGSHDDSAVVSVKPPKSERLELVPGGRSSPDGTPGLRCLLHYEGNCLPPRDVSNEVRWSTVIEEEPSFTGLVVTSSSHPSGRAELCDTVVLRAVRSIAPGRKKISAHYLDQSVSTLVPFGSGKSEDVTTATALQWSTGAPSFQVRKTGSVSVTATDFDTGQSASLDLDVAPPSGMPFYPAASIHVPASMQEGGYANLLATLFSCEGAKTDAALNWISLTPDLLDCSPGGRCQARASGVAQVALQLKGSVIARRSIRIESKPQNSSTASSSQAGTSSKPKKTDAITPPVPPQTSKEWQVRSEASFVTSLYEAILDRKPDDGGYRHWIGRLRSGKSRQWVIEKFFESPEYQSRKKSNQEFVRDLIQATSGREPSSAEMTAALARLQEGKTRIGLVKMVLSGGTI